jgi:DNA-binding IclR family transcriptional regulator
METAATIPLARDARIAAGDDAVRSVHRAYSLLALVALEQPNATLTTLARRTDLAVSTVARLLATLESLGLVRRLDKGGFAPGVRMLQLGAAARTSFDVVQLAEPFLDRLNGATGENTNLAVRIDAGHFTYIRQYMSRHAVRHRTWVGRTMPLKGSANGAVLLGKIPAQGYVAMHDAVERDVSAIAAPVYGADGEIVAALSIAAPTYRMGRHEMQRYARLLLDAAAHLGQELGAGAHATAATPRARASRRPRVHTG